MKGQDMNTSLPVTMLTVLGALTVVLGLFAAGSLAVVGLGFGALIAAGLIHALETRRRDGVEHPPNSSTHGQR